jgi:enoyl-CoA hydratase/carnithine racemase
VRNAFDAAMREALLDGLAIATADPSAEQIVIDGAGPNFCSGGDLAEFGTLADPASAHLLRVDRSVGRAVHRLRDRTTFVVHGACIGAGVEIPAFAGRVIARPDATFRLPEVAMGLVPGAGGTVSIPRRIGRERFRSLALTGAMIDATTALSWGLVDQIEGA